MRLQYRIQNMRLRMRHSEYHITNTTIGISHSGCDIQNVGHERAIANMTFGMRHSEYGIQDVT